MLTTHLFLWTNQESLWLPEQLTALWFCFQSGPMDSAGSPEPDRTQNSDGPAAVSSSSSPLTSAPPYCPVQTPPTSTDAAVRQSGGRKRGLAEAGGAGPVQEGKRTRRPTLKIRESKELQVREVTSESRPAEGTGPDRQNQRNLVLVGRSGPQALLVLFPGYKEEKLRLL